jgi:hypothetical protein
MTLMQDCGAAGYGANCEVDRYPHDRALPRTRQGLKFFKSLFGVRLSGAGFWLSGAGFWRPLGKRDGRRGKEYE